MRAPKLPKGCPQRPGHQQGGKGSGGAHAAKVKGKLASMVPDEAIENVRLQPG